MPTLRKLLAAVAVACAFIAPGYAQGASEQERDFAPLAHADHARVLGETYGKRASTDLREALDLRNGYRSSAGASPGPGKARYREDDHSPRSTDYVTCTRGCKA